MADSPPGGLEKERSRSPRGSWLTGLLGDAPEGGAEVAGLVGRHPTRERSRSDH